MSMAANSGTRRATCVAAAAPTQRKPPKRGEKRRKADWAVTDYIMTRTMIMLTDAYQDELARKCRVPATEAYQHWCEMNSLMQQGTALRDSAIAELRAMWDLGVPPQNVALADDFIREHGFLDHFRGAFGTTYRQFKMAEVNLDRFQEGLGLDGFQIDYGDTPKAAGQRDGD